MGIMKGVRTGTCNYRSLKELKKANPTSYKEALKEGRLLVGKPPVPSTCKLLVDKEGRYHLEEI